MALKRLPLIAQAANRADSATIDARLVNGMPEKDANGLLWCYKRPGIIPSIATGINLQAIGQIPGFQAPVNFTTSDFSLITNPPSGLSHGLVNVRFLGVASGPLIAGVTGSYFFYAPTAGGSYSSYLYTPSTIAASGVPAGSNFVPGVANLDGTFYVMDVYGNISGSDVKDPSTWNAANVIVTNPQGGPAVYLGQQLSYVIAFQSYDIQIFYDAANATGSPLAPVQSSRITFGVADVNSIAHIDEIYLFVAQGTSGERFVAQLENITAKPVSTPAIDRLLIAASSSAGAGFTSTAVRIMGHRLYLLSLTGLNVTLAYDLDLQVWSEWPSTQLTSFLRGTFTINNVTVFAAQGALWTFSQAVATDNGSEYAWELYSPPFDGGSRMIKYCPRMEFLTDNTPVKDLEVRWSDDDQQTWTNFRKVNLASSYPSLTGCGRFRRRTFHFRHTGAQPLRLQAVDLLLEEGTL